MGGGLGEARGANDVAKRRNIIELFRLFTVYKFAFGLGMGKLKETRLPKPFVKLMFW